jgi:membrane protein
MTSLWKRGGLTWKELGLRLWRQIWEDELLGRCAELAYFFLFSIFPLLVFLTTLFGYIAEANPGLQLDLMVYFRRISPSGDVSDLLVNTLHEITAGRTGTKLWVSLIAAIWVASNGMIATGRTLNIACGLKETRRWYRRRVIAILLTLVFAVLIVSALVVIFYGGAIARTLDERLGLDILAFLWRLVQWPLMTVFAVVSFEMVYNYAPNLGESPERPWFTPGAVTGVFLWLIASFGLRAYLAWFHSFSTAYGSLGAVILLLVWFYLTAFAILMGGEVNSEIGKEIERLRQEREGDRPRKKKKRRVFRF